MKTQERIEVPPRSPQRRWRAAFVAGAALVLVGMVALAAVLQDDQPPAAGPPGTLLEVLEERGGFDTFLTLVGEYDFFRQRLGPSGQATVLAPPDEAFESGALEFLRAPGNERYLIDLLSRHVVNGEHRHDDLLTGEPLLLNPPLTSNLVTVEDGVITITGQANTDVEMSDVRVVESDIDASNGVIHVVDGLLLPTDLGS